MKRVDDESEIKLFNRTTELRNFKKEIVEMYIDDDQKYLFYN